MAEPFSTVAAAIALAGAVLKVSKTAKNFVDGIQGAPSSVKALSGDVSSLIEVLALLEQYLRDLQGRRQQVEQARIASVLKVPLENCRKSLNAVETYLGPFVKHDKSSMSGKWKGIAWSYREKEMMGLQRSLLSSQQVLNSAIAVVHLYVASCLLLGGHQRGS